jgi:hypothetical protein
MGRYLLALMGPRSSIGSPITFMIRPSVPGYLLASGVNGTYANGNHDGGAGGFDGLSSDKTFGTVHSNASNGVLSKMLSNFENKSLPGWGVYNKKREWTRHTNNLQGVENQRQFITVKMHLSISNVIRCGIHQQRHLSELAE